MIEVLIEPREFSEGEEGPEKGIEIVLGCWLGWNRSKELLSDFCSSGFESKVLLPDMVRKNAGVLLETLGRTLKGDDFEGKGIMDVRNLMGKLDGLVIDEEKVVLDVWKAGGERVE